MCYSALLDLADNVSERAIIPDDMNHIDFSKPKMKNEQVEILVISDME
jgi:hypothetical protein